ncbi:MAG TPA: TetR/AcrR family transcriptional regulator [Pseudonocardia sp.]|jgi:AcrR family transcriptional regulator
MAVVPKVVRMLSPTDQPAPGGAPPKPARRLDRDTVVRTALRVADTSGLGALTMRRLASELDVGVMTLYSYVRTKEELVDRVLRLALESMDPDPDPAAPWDRQLEVALTNLHHALRAHPGATQILVSSTVPGPILDPLRERLLGILRGAGFGMAESITSLNALYSYVVGFTSVAGDHGVPAANDGARLAALPPDRYPLLVEAAEEFTHRFSERSFEFGLGLLLSGLRAGLARILS